MATFLSRPKFVEARRVGVGGYENEEASGEWVVMDSTESAEIDLSDKEFRAKYLPASPEAIRLVCWYLPLPPEPVQVRALVSIRDFYRDLVAYLANTYEDLPRRLLKEIADELERARKAARELMDAACTLLDANREIPVESDDQKGD